jgi:mannose-6-phosphate isomerase-like protein (cupin superfamily)
MSITRRDICVLLPMSAAFGLKDFPENSGAIPGPVLKSTVYNYADLVVEREGGDGYIPVFEGNTHTGVHLKLHETDLAPGAVAHAPHHHAGEEVFMVREGILEIEIDGVSSHLGPGSVAYVASNAEHAIRNSSQAGTRYFVLLLGNYR